MKILLAVSRRLTALQYFRQDMPHAALSRTNPEITYGKITTDVVGGFPDVMQLSDEVLEEYDIVSYLRQISFNKDFNIQTVNFLRSKGKKIIFDIDDWWRVPRTHHFFPHYEKHKAPECIEHTMSLVDAVTTTNGYLADKIEPHNENVWVLPNCIDPQQPQFTKRNIKSSLIRVGWVGGVHHMPDIEILREPLKKVHSLPNVQLCIGGFNTWGREYVDMEAIFTNGYRSLIDQPDYLDYLRHVTPAMEHIGFNQPYRRLWSRSINDYADIYNDLDVALAPLADNNFNRCKSELKIIEAGWMGKAVIASDIYPYNEVIEHGHDGFLAYRNIDWYVYIKRYADNPDLIRLHAERLEKKIREFFNIYDVNKIRKELYNNLIFTI